MRNDFVKQLFKNIKLFKFDFSLAFKLVLFTIY